MITTQQLNLFVCKKDVLEQEIWFEPGYEELHSRICNIILNERGGLLPRRGVQIFASQLVEAEHCIPNLSGQSNQMLTGDKFTNSCHTGF